jgi:hypothetical protein
MSSIWWRKEGRPDKIEGLMMEELMFDRLLSTAFCWSAG